MLKDKVQKALNDQINMELFSSYTYLSMSAFFESINYEGFANWMKKQSEEEYSHAIKFFDYVHDRDGKITLTKLDSPKTEWNSVLDVFGDTLKHEQAVTASINSLVELSSAEKDHATFNFLQWFVSEQVEEEASVTKIIERLRMIGDNTNGLLFLDRELGKRE